MTDETVEHQEPSSEEKKFSQGEVESIIQGRVRKQTQESEKEKAELRARIADLESKTKAAPMANEGRQTVAPEEPRYSADDVNMLAQQQSKARMLAEKLSKAEKEDEEFKKLANGGSDHKMPPDVLYEMNHLDNAPAVVKHLLKNKGDHRIMEELAEQVRRGETNKVEFIKFINSLSEKVDNNTSKPHASNFKPEPDIINSVDNDDEFDVSTHIKNKSRTRRKSN